MFTEFPQVLSLGRSSARGYPRALPSLRIASSFALGALFGCHWDALGAGKKISTVLEIVPEEVVASGRMATISKKSFPWRRRPDYRKKRDRIPSERFEDEIAHECELPCAGGEMCEKVCGK